MLWLADIRSKIAILADGITENTTDLAKVPELIGLGSKMPIEYEELVGISNWPGAVNIHDSVGAPEATTGTQAGRNSGQTHPNGGTNANGSGNSGSNGGTNWSNRNN